MPPLQVTASTRVALYLAIARDQRPQYRIAAVAGRSDAWLSRVVHGLADPSAQDRARLSEVLGVGEDGLFPNPGVTEV